MSLWRRAGFALPFLFFFSLFGCISQEPRQPASNPANTERNPWWGASESQVQTAVCRERLPRTAQELRNFFAIMEDRFVKNSDGGTSQLFDLKLENQPGTLVRSLYELLTPGPVFNQKVKQIEKPKNRFHIGDDCTRSACIAEKIFGPTIGLQMLYLQSEFHINTSPYSYDDSTAFTEDELWDILAALELLPPGNLPFHLNQKLTHYPRETSERTLLANATMGFYTRWSKAHPHHRQYIVLHEFAHNYGSNFVDDLANLDEWLTVTGWERTPENRELFKRPADDHDGGLISGYSKTNPREDFAESVSAYRLNPFELRELSPSRYNFIRDTVFDGLEFTHTEACERQPFFERLIRQGKISVTAFSNEALAQVAKQCQPEYASSRLGHLPLIYFKDCVQREGLIAYFSLIEKKPIPRGLLSEKFVRANVNIKGLEDAVLQLAARNAMNLIWKTIGGIAFYQNPAKDCKRTPWTTLNQVLVEREGISFVKKPLKYQQYAVNPAKVSLLCQNLINGRHLNGFNEAAVLRYLQSLR